MNLLFVCSKNRRRSRTAETLFRNHHLHQVRSAGTDEGAEVKLTARMLSWADLVLVMEKRHRDMIQDRFDPQDHEGKIVVLGIPDEYAYMDDELISLLQEAVADLKGE